MVQWLGLGVSTAGDAGLIPGQGSKIPWATWHNQKKKKKPTQSTTPRANSKANYRLWVMMCQRRFISGITCPTLGVGVWVMLLVGEVAHGGGKQTEVIQDSASRSILLWTWNCSQKIKSTLKLLNHAWALSMYTHSLLLPFFFFNLVTHSCNFLTSNRLFRVCRNICKTSLENRRDWHNTVNQLYLNKKKIF